MEIQDNQNKPMNTSGCQYSISSGDNWQCQNQTSYNCTHCPSSFCSKHGIKHQQDLKAEIHRLLAETEVSYDDLTKKRFCFTRNFLRWIYFMEAGGSFVLTNKLYIRLLHCLTL